MDKKKKIIFLVVLLIVMIGTITSISFGFLEARVGNPASSDVNISSNTVDSLVFETGSPITFTLNEKILSTNGNNITSSSFARATLQANNSTNKATKNYYIYLDVSSNSFVYSKDENHPEILLRVLDSNVDEVKNLSGLTYKTVTDGQNNTISGYDITTLNKPIEIISNKEITANPKTIEEWNIAVTFVNYDFNQSANAGKKMSAKLIIQQEPLEYMLGDVDNDGEITIDDSNDIIDYLNDNSLFNKYQITAADVNKDGEIDEIDTDIILANVLGEIKELPYGTPNKYSITFDLNGGTKSGRFRSKYASNVTALFAYKPSKEGYGFIGWTGSNGTTPQETITIENGTTGNLTYTANYALLGDLNNNGNINIIDRSILINYLTKIKTDIYKDVADLNRDGIVDFLDDDNLANYIAGEIDNISYIPEKIYNISYNLDGGKFLNSDGKEYQARSRYSSITVDTIDTPKKDGYTFLGWTGSNGTTPQTSINLSSFTGDLMLKANWQKN